MKIILLLLVFASLLAAQTSKTPEPKAFLRYRAASNSAKAAYYIAVFPDPALVFPDSARDPKSKLSLIKIALYGGSSKLIPAQVAIPADPAADPAAAPLNVEIEEKYQEALIASFDELSLVISTYPIEVSTVPINLFPAVERSLASEIAAK